MSAYMVNTRHIDALLTAALRGEIPGCGGYPLRWYWDGESRTIDRDNADRMGQMLLSENAASVSYRYDRETPAPPYTFRRRDGLQAVEILKAINGFTYQACEHPGWESSEARAFCEALQGMMIRRLPGYEEADTWEVSD